MFRNVIDDDLLPVGMGVRRLFNSNEPVKLYEGCLNTLIQPDQQNTNF